MDMKPAAAGARAARATAPGLELTPLSQPGPLTPMDRFIFESWGYLLIPDVLSLDECAEALEACQRVHGSQPAKVFRQVGRGYETEPALERLIDHPAVLPKIRGILGERFVLCAGWCTVVPAHGVGNGWHRDHASSYDYSNISSPAPLLQLRASFNVTDQSELGMGNMALIPGSHRSAAPLPDEMHDQMYAAPIQHIIRARPGTVLIFHNAVWHSPMPSQLDYDRYNMHYIYTPPWMRRGDRFETDPAFLARTTPRRRALLGEFDRPDTAFSGGNYPPIPFDD